MESSLIQGFDDPSALEALLLATFHAQCQGHLLQEAFPELSYPWFCLSFREGTILPSLSYEVTWAPSEGSSG